MTAIHAYRRTAPTTVELYGQSIQFKPNDKKDVVAEVLHEKAAARLLSITEAYRLYEPVELAGIVAQQLTASIGATAPVDAEELQKVVADQSSQIEALKRQVQELNQAAAAAASAGESTSVSANSGTGDGAKAGEGADKPMEQASSEGENASTDERAGESPYVFANEAGETIDISEWTAAQIRTFAESNEISLPKGNSVKVGELRDLLADALRAGSKE
ncbi:SlyX family protein [Comamonas sp. Tr-654]|uniref:SlyX family protein n=1 Tax=Comamonas sp. Tr-654 TaxID=2608341 RepID=UPI0014226676|nr:SlyX family protein [Comamonas sp. Tr-654]NIF85363.1 SlyX family protein [Comamonas sp. Tr-654]